MVSFRPKQPGTWSRIIAARRTAKYQNSLPTCFSLMNALAILIRVCRVCSANPFDRLASGGICDDFGTVP